MVSQIIVPVDGSEDSNRAIDIGDRFAHALGATLEVVRIADAHTDVSREQRLLRREVRRHVTHTVAPAVRVLPMGGVPTAVRLRDHVLTVEDPLVVMASAGRGRSGAVVGSVATEVVRGATGPVVLVGPDVAMAPGPYGCDVVAALDGSTPSEAVLPIAGALAGALDAHLWLTTVIRPDAVTGDDTFESNYVARLAERLGRKTVHPVEFEVLHGNDAARSVVDFATRAGAGLIAATTHGRTGLARLALGSTSAAIVRHAKCPVLLLRPPTTAPWPTPEPSFQDVVAD